ncbi:MAG: signal peptidase I [Candidatus Eisenbacteria bacterium]|nr:signal peptidase I [Candidatus Eisenbacteria bacterium]
MNARAEGRTIERPSRKSVVREYAEALFFAIILTIFIRTFVIQAFRIPSGSMENTLLVGDYLFVNKFLYGAKVPFSSWSLPAVRQPRRGDVIVFKFPEDTKKDFIKRCIGTPGDKVEIRDKVVYVNDQPIDEPYVKLDDARILPRSYSSQGIFPARGGNKDNYGPITVPPNHLFMMGDNRDHSDDSRYWGFMNTDLIKGKAIFIYFSLDQDKKLAGMIPMPRLDRVGDMIR